MRNWHPSVYLEMAELRLLVSEHHFDNTKPAEKWRAKLLQATSLRITRADQAEAEVRPPSLSYAAQAA